MNDDDDMGALFRARADASKIKRAMNREASAQRLTEAGVPFVVKNNGAHLIVDDGRWDFWAGTGLFKSRHLPVQGRGVRKLLAEIAKSRPVVADSASQSGVKAS